MAQRQLRIGVVGTNGGTDRWGARAHLPAIAALEEAELVAVCTAREETAKRAQQRTGARLSFWNYEVMVRSPEIDLAGGRYGPRRAAGRSSLRAGMPSILQ